ncbi:MAG TPA: hypothetical protein VHA82_20395 [Ramlibacter sp.]|uniref:hypothetical protein n=1 Tax=Ramlibacter sp. TaxID=1917967 RepID=UPI002BDCC25E|nr:hypothetical protein [Ramlibacter sp.]HVZ46179.1 hypothetical protein [Ramlibacter sp.]
MVHELSPRLAWQDEALRLSRIHDAAVRRAHEARDELLDELSARLAGCLRQGWYGLLHLLALCGVVRTVEG